MRDRHADRPVASLTSWLCLCASVCVWIWTYIAKRSATVSCIGSLVNLDYKSYLGLLGCSMNPKRPRKNILEEKKKTKKHLKSELSSLKSVPYRVIRNSVQSINTLTQRKVKNAWKCFGVVHISLGLCRCELGNYSSFSSRVKTRRARDRVHNARK